MQGRAKPKFWKFGIEGEFFNFEKSPHGLAKNIENNNPEST